VVTVTVLAGFWLVAQTQPFIIWLSIATIGPMVRSIGALQILLIDDKRLHPEFRVGKLATPLLWFTFVSGFVAVGVWLVSGGFAEIVSRWTTGV
jgi:hypothetical protein